MDRILLILLIVTVWGIIFLVTKVMPHDISAVVAVITFMSLYAMTLTATLLNNKRIERKRPTPVNTDYLPGVSIIIPAHNEAKVIAGTVENMMLIDYPAFDILVVDDRSSDDTAAVLKALCEKYPGKFNYHVRKPGDFPGKSAVLNEALPMTKHEVVCVFDADAYVEPDFLRRMVPFLADERVGAVQCRKVICNYKHNWLTRCQDYEYSLDAHFQTGRDSIRGAVELRGNGQLVKRKALESVGGWNNYSVTDDLDLSIQLHLNGWDIRFAHRVKVWEEGIVKYSALLRQRKRWAEGNIRRYLEHAGAILTSQLVSVRTKVDMIAYLIEFLFPLWLASDYLLLGYALLQHEATKNHVISSLCLIPLVSIFFTGALVAAIIRFNRQDLSQEIVKMTMAENPLDKLALAKVFLDGRFYGAVASACMTGVYMVLIWLPSTVFVMFKILFQKGRLSEWGKTEHFGENREMPV